MIRYIIIAVLVSVVVAYVVDCIKGLRNQKSVPALSTDQKEETPLWGMLAYVLPVIGLGLTLSQGAGWVIAYGILILITLYYYEGKSFQRWARQKCSVHPFGVVNFAILDFLHR